MPFSKAKTELLSTKKATKATEITLSSKPLQNLRNKQRAQCLKITEKVSFNIASYVYILSRQKLIKNAKNGPIWRVFENLKLAVKPDRPALIGQKLVESTKIQMRHFG